jgi:hypothetical protein
MTGKRPARRPKVRLEDEPARKPDEQGDEPIPCASPPCLMDEIDPAWFGFEPEEPPTAKDRRAKRR